MIGGWQDMRTAPRDGRIVEVLVRHRNFEYAGIEDRGAWSGTASAYWTGHNGGGWAWSGLYGDFVAWRKRNAV